MEKERKGLEVLEDLKKNSFLPPIRKDFEMELLSEEELAGRSKVANERKETAQTYAEQEIQIRTTLQYYKKTVPNWEFLPRNDPVRMEIDRLQKRLEELVSIDGELGESKEFAYLLKEIQLIDEFPSAVKMLERLEKREKRIYIPSEEEISKERKDGKWPEGALFFNGEVYFQKLETPGARILNKRVRELTHRANASKINRMAVSGSHNLTGIRREMPGKYYLFSARHKEEKNGRVFTRAESHTLVKIFDKNKGQKDARPYLILEVEDAFLGTTWMLEGLKGRTLSFPLFWFARGRVIIAKEKRRPPEDEENHINNVIRVLNGILYGWENSQKKAEPVKTPEPAPTETPKEDEAPMQAKFDRAIATTDGAEIKVFVKPVKPKKEKASLKPIESTN